MLPLPVDVHHSQIETVAAAAHSAAAAVSAAGSGFVLPAVVSHHHVLCRPTAWVQQVALLLPRLQPTAVGLDSEVHLVGGPIHCAGCNLVDLQTYPKTFRLAVPGGAVLLCETRYGDLAWAKDGTECSRRVVRCLRVLPALLQAALGEELAGSVDAAEFRKLAEAIVAAAADASIQELELVRKLGLQKHARPEVHTLRQLVIEVRTPVHKVS